MEPFRLLPQLQLLGSQASAYPACQLFELGVTIGYPEIVGESPQQWLQVFYDLFQINGGTTPGYAAYFLLELHDLASLDACIAAAYYDT